MKTFWKSVLSVLALTCVAGDVAPRGGTTIERLRPGEYFWAPQVAPEGPLMMIVSLGAQRAIVYRNGIPIGATTVSTGKEGHETPTGVFTVLQKRADHKSNLYADAPMPFMQRLTWDGIALHGGNLPGYPASHGCVRLPLAFAKELFAVSALGLVVVITENAKVPEVAPIGQLLAPLRDGHGAPGTYRWNPERSLEGPVSILVSGRDRRMIVLRNGIEIGSSVIRLDRAVTRTEAFVLRGATGKGGQWLRLPLPGQPAAARPALTAEEQAQGHLPEAFRAALEEIVRPGTTLLVTRESVPSSGTGARMTILDTETP